MKKSSEERIHRKVSLFLCDLRGLCARVLLMEMAEAGLHTAMSPNLNFIPIEQAFAHDRDGRYTYGCLKSHQLRAKARSYRQVRTARPVGIASRRARTAHYRVRVA